MGFNFGGLGQNRTADTRIFNPSINCSYIRSKIAAMPWPPPMHIVTRA